MNVRLLLSTQRSGSHFLKSLVQTRFPDVICSGEVLEEPVAHVRQAPALASHPESPHFGPWLNLQTSARDVRNEFPGKLDMFGAYLRLLADQANADILVVDAKYQSVNALAGCVEAEYASRPFTMFLNEQSIPVLHLIRRNILRIIVSYKLARESGIWHRQQQRSESDLLPKIRLNPKGVLVEIRYALALIAQYRSLLQDQAGYAEVFYEDLVTEEESGYPGPSWQALSRFFGREVLLGTCTDQPYRKTTPEDFREVVENWEDIVRLLDRTEHAWMTQSTFVLT